MALYSTTGTKALANNSINRLTNIKKKPLEFKPQVKNIQNKNSRDPTPDKGMLCAKNLIKFQV